VSDQVILEEFKAHGITKYRTQRALLALVNPDKAPKGVIERWQKLGIMDEQRRIILGKGESIEDLTLWLIFAGVWEGDIERVSP